MDKTFECDIHLTITKGNECGECQLESLGSSEEPQQ